MTLRTILSIHCTILRFQKDQSCFGGTHFNNDPPSPRQRLFLIFRNKGHVNARVRIADTSRLIHGLGADGTESEESNLHHGGGETERSDDTGSGLQR